MIFLRTIIGWIFGGGLSRILDTIDKTTDAGVERDKARLEAVQSYARAQVDMVNGPGRWLLSLFVVPLGFWFTMVCFHTVFWCQECMFPQVWKIGNLPDPLNEWSGWIITSLFGYGAALGVANRVVSSRKEPTNARHHTDNSSDPGPGRGNSDRR